MVLVQLLRRLFIGKGPWNHHNIVLTRFSLIQMLQEQEGSHRLSHARRCGRIMPDHGGFRDDRLRDGLHRCIPDDRRRLIDPDDIQFLDASVDLLHGIFQS